MSSPSSRTDAVAGMRMHQRLAVRIWLAVVALIMVLTLVLGWLWHMQRERERAQTPGRLLVIRDAQGTVIGETYARAVREPGRPPEFELTLPDGQTLSIQLPRPPRPPGWRPDEPPWAQTLSGLATLLLVVAVAVALGAYPIVRRLTKRLEALQQGVERWGAGDLSTRLPVQGRDEVAFLAERFNAAAERVQSLLLAHKSLLANASHELRSPLARIRMGLELLGNGSGSGSPAARQEIARNIAELDTLIDEILLASRLDQTDPERAVGQGQWEEVDLLGLAAEECARVGAELDVEPDWSGPVVRGEARLLRRLVRNLLENARRHGAAAGGASRIETVLKQLAAPAGVELRVIDHGAGVPSLWRERIFEPFFRLPGASEREGGVGLGLALVRTIAVRHGGRVYCEDTPGGGATFVVCFPTQS
ncbi:MAG TPA: HAMP domain-containing sensor histidine kinase [Macromonas sp.]|nr:HAMP domain-containing sensor histidine kinase [Macromonas sp.]